MKILSTLQDANSARDSGERLRITDDDYSRPRPKGVIGPNGNLLTLGNLPAPRTKRWVIRLKAEIVAAVRGGLLSLEEACRRYKLTVEEFLAWEYFIEYYGLPGLRTTRIQIYRQRTDSIFTAPNGRICRRYVPQRHPNPEAPAGFFTSPVYSLT